MGRVCLPKDQMSTGDAGAFVLPDPIISPSLLSGALLLYFDGPFIFAAPPAVLTADSFQLIDLVRSRKPPWGQALLQIVLSLHGIQKLSLDTLKKVQQVLPNTVHSAYYAYPANWEAYSRVDSWVEASKADYAVLKDATIAPLGAAELARHIFLERYLELERDHEGLYKYCDYILGSGQLDSLISASYLLRLQVLLNLPDSSRLLLTNEALAPFLESIARSHLQEEHPNTPGDGTVSGAVDPDVVAWEFFRVIVSRLIDPLDYKKLDKIRRIRLRYGDQVQRLKTKCRELANSLDHEETIVGLGHKAISEINRTIKTELTEMLEIDNHTWRKYISDLSSDKVAWASLAGAIGGIAGSSAVPALTCIIGALVSVGTTALKARSARNARLKESDLSLLRVLHSSKLSSCESE